MFRSECPFACSDGVRAIGQRPKGTVSENQMRLIADVEDGSTRSMTVISGKIRGLSSGRMGPSVDSVQTGDVLEAAQCESV